MSAPFQIICLAGPTGAGKTALALKIAARYNCEIINADSRQVYQDFPLITAQPSLAEQSAAPHHLYGFLPTQNKISAGQWVEMTSAYIQKISSKNKVPLLVGGTGFYFEALLRGLAPMPDIPHAITEEFSQKILREGAEKLHEQLSKIDPEYAARVHPHDKQRIQRAWEIYATSGKTFSWFHQQGRACPVARGPLLTLNPPLTWLEPRLKARIDAMLQAGAITEAKNALKNCCVTTAPGWSGIGCRELAAYLQNQIGLDECKKQWLASTRAYAKRQLTWFRGRKEAIFISHEGMDSAFEVIEKTCH